MNERSIQTSESLLCLCDRVELTEPLRGVVKSLRLVLEYLGKLYPSHCGCLYMNCIADYIILNYKAIQVL